MKKIIIVAMTEDQVIGNNREVPWYYPEDMKHFKEKTIGHPVIMGRKTYESLPEEYKPLPDRKNIVLTNSKIDVSTENNVHIANSLEEAWNIAEQGKEKNKVFIIGGEEIYRQTINEVGKMIVTKIHEKYEGDTYFPDWNKENWKEIKREEKGDLSFIEYIRDN